MRYLIGHLLESSAQAAPDAPAVVDRDQSITYGELDTAANRIANLLVELGVDPGERVVIYLDKSIESIVSIYGVLKAGAAYVPLDPQAPPARLGYIAKDAGARVLLTGAEKRDAWQPIRDAA